MVMMPAFTTDDVARPDAEHAVDSADLEWED